MNRIASAIPIGLIRAIGPAQGSGRRVWEKLAKLCEAAPHLAVALADELPKELSSTQRLELAINRMNAPLPPAAQAARSDLISVRRKGNKITLEADPAMLPQLENAIRCVVDSLLDRGQDEATSPTSGAATPS
jgi:ParB family chromosome partitioning protein